MPRSPFFALFLPSDLVNIITVLALGATKVKQAQMANTPTTVTNEPFTMKTSKFSVKGTYTGEWKDGKPNGEGTMTMSQDDDRWNKGDTLWSKNWSNGLID